MYISGGTVHIFVLNRHGTHIRYTRICTHGTHTRYTLGSMHEALRRIQAIHPQSRRGDCSNATLFDNRQQKNSECRELRT